LARNHLTLCVSLACLLSALGCGPKSGDLVPVSGRVTWEGAAVTTGNITFVPAQSAESRPSTGQIQSDGTYQMSTFQQADGVPPGKYRVAIDSTPPPPVETMPGQDLPRGPVPASYADPTTSGLEATVEAGYAVEIDFALPK
jgi:hypothetical protein